eukprot:m.710086 g.710086  ORF g.710086 m.710086 type:complete len:234 (-) comp58756_c0_seq2:81-782(-)
MLYLLSTFSFGFQTLFSLVFQDLERFVGQELEAQADTATLPETRLSIYRQAFWMFMEQFSTYRPFLSTVQREYDSAIAAIKGEVQQIERLKREISISQRTHEQRLSDLIMQYEDQLRSAQFSSAKLREEMVKAEREKLDCQTKIAVLTRELAEEHARFREENMARRLLLMDDNIDGLRSQNQHIPNQLKFDLIVRPEHQGHVLAMVDAMKLNPLSVGMQTQGTEVFLHRVALI